MLSTRLLQVFFALTGVISLALAAPAKEYRMQPRVMVRPAHLEISGYGSRQQSTPLP
jgi:hypothetical protein